MLQVMVFQILDHMVIVIFYHRKIALFAYIKPTNWQGATTIVIHIRLLSLLCQYSVDTMIQCIGNWWPIRHIHIRLVVYVSLYWSLMLSSCLF
jgi:hypothetical protein